MRLVLLLSMFVVFASCEKEPKIEEPEIIPPTEEELQLELQRAKLVGTWKMVEYHEIQTKQDGITIGREYSYDETEIDFTWQFKENGLGVAHEDLPRYEDISLPPLAVPLDYEFEWKLYYNNKLQGSMFNFEYTRKNISDPPFSPFMSTGGKDVLMLDRITDNELDISYSSLRMLEAPAPPMPHQLIEITFEKVGPEEQ